MATFMFAVILLTPSGAHAAALWGPEKAFAGPNLAIWVNATVGRTGAGGDAYGTAVGLETPQRMPRLLAGVRTHLNFYQGPLCETTGWSFNQGNEWSYIAYGWHDCAGVVRAVGATQTWLGAPNRDYYFNWAHPTSDFMVFS
ncbi:hypothetical protein [Nocardioides alkalitolerans]|uniref:hypothetical protein n=1 Tax=Nocardioides alkalitolerans TaxID=281714 RepID=UPI00048F398B|nr:hypothetical protein [Nocardioides alkalitolerans]